MSVTGTSTTVSLSSNASARRVCARSVDNAGNVSEVTCSNAYSVDSTNPTISITSTSVISNSITVTVRGSDSHSGIYQYKFSSNNGSSYTTVTSSNGTYTYTITGLSSGTAYTIAVQSVDRAGNTSSKVTRSVTTDDIPFEAITAGDNYLYILKNDDTIWRQQYVGSSSNWIQITGLTDIKTITAGDYLYALKNDGTLWWYNTSWHERSLPS